MYTDQVPVFSIDLDDEEYERWDEVITADKKVVKRLAKEADEDYEAYPGFVKTVLGTAVSLGYRLWGGRYMGEIQAWADALGRSVGDVTLMNCAYEMSHIPGGMFGGVLGCTAGIRWVPKLGMVHVRNLDWPLPSIGRATRIFEYFKGDRNFLAVGISGFVGVLSGMLPGAYSVTINWAPPAGRPKFDFGPAFLLREVLETCDTYEEAVHALKHTALSAPVFFTVCGKKRGQACVIERTHQDAAVRKFKAPALVQGNHHVAHKFVANNTDEELLEDSKERVATLERALKESSASSLAEVATCLDVEPVLNDESYQQMAFCPKTGQVLVWRRED